MINHNHRPVVYTAPLRAFYRPSLYTADAVMHTPKAPSDEGAGFLRSKKTGGERFLFSLPPSKIKDFAHLPHQREAYRCGGIMHCESFLEPPADGFLDTTKNRERDHTLPFLYPRRSVTSKAVGLSADISTASVRSTIRFLFLILSN